MAGIRCSDCRKFTGNDVEVELGEPEVDGEDLVFSADITVNCSDCGGQKVTGSTEYRETLDHDCGDEAMNDLNASEGLDLTVTVDTDGEGYKNRNGAGTMLSISITCNRCGGTIDPPALHVETDDLS